MNENINEAGKISTFTRYSGARPLAETSIDDIPLAEQSAYWKSLGQAESEEYTDEEADQLYAAWMRAQQAYLLEPQNLTGARVFRLIFNTTVTVIAGSGRIESSMHDDGESGEAKAAIDALESMILAHAVAGIDVSTPGYQEGIETAVEAIRNQHGD